MWKSVVGHNVSVKAEAEGDDWDTDPDFVNDVSEQEQRWGAKTIEGSGRSEHFSVHQLREHVSKEHEEKKKKELAEGPKASYGYGGKFGVEKDRMDKVAMGHGYVAEVDKHSSQTDAAQGFGGKYGVQKDRIDKSAVGFEYKGQVEQHASQKDYSKGFGGKYGVERDKVDKAALGYDYKAETEKHESQKDYTKGFGGRYGVQTDRMDKGAASFTEMEAPTSSYQKTQPVEASSSGASSLKARFENMAKATGEEDRRRAEEERARRQAREKREQEEARKRQQQEAELSTREEEEPPAPKTPAIPSSRVPQASPALPERRREVPEPVPELEPEPCYRQAEEQEDPEYEEPPDLPPRLVEMPSTKEEEEEEPGVYEDVSVVTSTDTAAENEYEEAPAGLCAVALYDYQGEGDDEISFDPDDIIRGIEIVDESWWKGQCRGRVGLFPATYVELMQ
ncbi:hematopoietic lineage cell-specific protein-like isoform X4 [Polyodon spathula]|uniref:hematopoietic lineage cell-specific protein-like isoform X4 n=1 Tax=Polyodon spathula TaxID=7913 RepID=UPI001B7ED164|nr:hematopoietic lineage cell-specific protein-like isoform X4 [Polyodon spathula]